MIRTSAKHEHKRENEEAADGKDFDRRKPELEFTEELDPEVVDEKNGNKKYRDENAWIDFVSIHPVLYD